MNDKVAIKVDHVSKKYCKSLKRSMLYGVRDITRNTLGLSSHSNKLRKDEFWALDDVSFEVKKGETLGIIGPNGAGKTTMLKMLNGIFWPDKGKITVKGRVGALIAVGSGFHPLLTGRENIYINAAILGMTKEEVDEKFDDIVEFADIGDFIDTPVKFYSSGMFVRLGFAVAVHCEPDILLVDEVLAVGDMAFQLKCQQRIGKLRNAGVSIVFISHNMAGIRALCDRAIFLSEGNVYYIGKSKDAILRYTEQMQKSIGSHAGQVSEEGGYRPGGLEAKIVEVKLLNSSRIEDSVFETGEKLIIRMRFIAYHKILNPGFGVGIHREDGLYCYGANSKWDGWDIPAIEGEGIVEFEVPSLNLLLGTYSVWAYLTEKTGLAWYDRRENACVFQVRGNKQDYGAFYLEHTWRFGNNPPGEVYNEFESE